MTQYRELSANETIQEGDEYFTGKEWRWTNFPGDTPNSMGFKYRRKLAPYHPSWQNPEAPKCPVHVLWAETPPSTATVPPVASNATPGALESISSPGEGYRFLGLDEIVVQTDEWRTTSGEWMPVCGTTGRSPRGSGFTYRRKLDPAFKTTANTSIPDPGPGYRLLLPTEKTIKGDEYCVGIDSWSTSYNYAAAGGAQAKEWYYRRKLLSDPKPQYRPYANAAEAAKALEGKLFRHEGFDRFYSVSKITNGVYFDGTFHSFEVMTEYRLTDGTPCGVRVDAE